MGAAANTTAQGDRRDHAEALGTAVLDLVPHAAIGETSDATLREIKEKLGLALSLATLWHAVIALGLTLKKVERAAERDRPDVAAQRAQL